MNTPYVKTYNEDGTLIDQFIRLEGKQPFYASNLYLNRRQRKRQHKALKKMFK